MSLQTLQISLNRQTGEIKYLRDFGPWVPPFISHALSDPNTNWELWDKFVSQRSWVSRLSSWQLSCIEFNISLLKWSRLLRLRGWWLVSHRSSRGRRMQIMLALLACLLTYLRVVGEVILGTLEGRGSERGRGEWVSGCVREIESEREAKQVKFSGKSLEEGARRMGTLTYLKFVSCQDTLWTLVRNQTLLKIKLWHRNDRS